jgi:hypothetical protein
MSVPGVIVQSIFKIMYYAIVHIIVPLFPIALYFLFFCIILTLIGNLSGILGFILFMVLFYFYVKGIIFYQPPVRASANTQMQN